MIDQPGEVIFQKLFSVRLKEGDNLLIVRGTGPDQTKIELDVSVFQRNAPKSITHGTIFFLRKRFGIDNPQGHVPTGRLLILFQQFLYPNGVTAYARETGGHFFRKVKPEGHGFFDAFQNIPGPFR